MRLEGNPRLSLRLPSQSLREQGRRHRDPAFQIVVHAPSSGRSRLQTAQRDARPAEWALAAAMRWPPTCHSAMRLAERSRRRTVPGSRVSTALGAQAHRRQLQSAAKSDTPGQPPPCVPRSPAHGVSPAPVRSEPAQNGVGYHRRKRQIQQARTVRHANFEAETKSLFIHRHDARHLGLHLAALEVEAQPHRLPGRGQLAADDLDHAGQDRLFNIGELRAAGRPCPRPPSSRSMMGGASARSSCSTDSAPSGSRRTEET